MRITSFNNKPVSEIPFLNAGRGQGSFYVDRLPVHAGQLSGLPDDLDAIIATADLQGRERFQDGIGGPPRLLGEVLPKRLAIELLPELNIIPERVGVILAGDFYTVPNLDKRGGSGDVTSVWQAFGRQFKWVVGVAGNHDTFGCSVAPSKRSTFFNPQIFHPLWYADNELIAREEVNDVKDLLCSDEISAFVLNEVHFQIERHRFGLTTKDPSRALSLRDLVVNTFTILEHTPLTAIGLNRDMRFRLEDPDLWHSIGHQLAPKAKWDGIIESPGMRIVAMEGQRKECNAEKVSIRVQPAGGVENGILIAVNQHYSLKNEDHKPIAVRISDAIQILNNDWKAFLSYSQNAATTLIERCRIETEAV